MPKPRVLAIAEAANPEWVSVPLIGWALSHALRDVADVHLVTQVRNRDAILRTGMVEGQGFTAINTEKLANPLHRMAGVLRMGEGKGWTTVTAIDALSYPYFERKVWQKFGPDIKAGAYDIVHRITPLTPATVSPIAAKCRAHNTAFVVGPLNGGVPWPSGFNAVRKQEREWLSYVRSAYKLLPGRNAMYKAASAVLAGSHHTAGEVPEAFKDKVFWLPENAIDTDRFNRVAAPYETGPMRACFVGRMVPYKGPDMVIEALRPYLSEGRATLDLVGDGPMRAELEALVEEWGLGAHVVFHGQLDHNKVQDVMTKSHVLTFPSVREFGGGVVLEAMATGVVPMVVDYAGPGELVDDEIGLKVPIGERAEIIRDFSAQFADILANPAQLGPKSKASLDRIEKYYTWDAKAAQVRAVYDWVLGATDAKPSLF